MNCPKCNSRLGVIDSRHTASNSTRRRLECPRCLSRYTSLESIVYNKNEIDVSVMDIFMKLARKAVVRSGYMSALTGATYATEEEAISDSIAELERLYED